MKVYTVSLLLTGIGFLFGEARAAILFNFDNAPLHGSLPLDLTEGGVTAYFTSSPPGGYSIQEAYTLGFTPVGFSGYCLYPNGIDKCDLLISFSQPLTDISILYAPHELATDSSCTMLITANMGTTFVGSNTHVIDPPGTWPSGTLSFSSAQPFDNVIIHYQSPPPTGGDYGTIFMADNLQISPVPEPAMTGLVTGLALAGFGLMAKWRRQTGLPQRIWHKTK